MGDALRQDALDAAAKVYSVRPHPYQPGLATILTSVGVLVLSLGRLPVSDDEFKLALMRHWSF